MSLDNFDWTRGGDSNLLPSRRIASGGYGDVYELYNITTGQSFARKLLRPGLISITSDDIKNEERAIKKLCGNPTHRNIVEVLRLGDLVNSPYYFIDMELCDLNLEDYIYRDPELPIENSIPRFVATAPSKVKAFQIWNIMKEISSGVAFIHSKDEIHRDLKPSNSTFLLEVANLVLYSRRHSTWKIADFGFATQGTSQTMHTSKARGTSCYRAPELLNEESERVSNKVDIWSLGCIMYELSVRRKAFKNDIAVFYHSMSDTTLTIDLNNSFDAHDTDKITRFIDRMLHRTASSRPSASVLSLEFSQHCQDFRPLPNTHGDFSGASVESQEDFEQAAPEELTPNAESTRNTFGVENSTSATRILSETPIRCLTLRYELRYSSSWNQINDSWVKVNCHNTCIATIVPTSVSIHFQKFRMTLWNALSGDEIWKEDLSWRPRQMSASRMAFSDCGNYFVYQGSYGYVRPSFRVMAVDSSSATELNLVLNGIEVVRALAVTRLGDQMRLGWVQDDLQGVQAPMLLKIGGGPVKIDCIHTKRLNQVQPLLLYAEDGKSLFFVDIELNVTKWDVMSCQPILQVQLSPGWPSRPTVTGMIQNQRYFGLTYNITKTPNNHSGDNMSSSTTCTTLWSLSSALHQSVPLDPNSQWFPVEGGFVSLRDDGVVRLWSTNIEAEHPLGTVHLQVRKATRLCAVACGEAYQWLTLIYNDGSIEFYRDSGVESGLNNVGGEHELVPMSGD